MKKYLLFSFLFISAFSILTEDVKKNALISKITGNAERKKKDVAKWNKLKTNTYIGKDESIRTASSSMVELKLSERRIIRIAPETTIDINAIFENKEGKKYTEFFIKKGSLWGNIEKDEDMDFSINTSICGTAIKGTVFMVTALTNKTTEIKVYKGRVEVKKIVMVTNIKPFFSKPHKLEKPYHQVSKEKWTYLLSNMQKIKIYADKESEVSKFTINDDRQSKQSEWIKINKKLDKDESLK